MSGGPRTPAANWHDARFILWATSAALSLAIALDSGLAIAYGLALYCTLLSLYEIFARRD